MYPVQRCCQSGFLPGTSSFARRELQNQTPPVKLIFYAHDPYADCMPPGVLRFVYRDADPGPAALVPRHCRAGISLGMDPGQPWPAWLEPCQAAAQDTECPAL